GHRLEVPVRAERRQDIVQAGRVDVPPLAPLVRRAAYRAVDPGAECRIVREQVDRADGRPQRVLDSLLRIFVHPGDAPGEAVDTLGVAFDELLGAGVTHAQVHASISVVRSPSVKTSRRAGAAPSG